MRDGRDATGEVPSLGIAIIGSGVMAKSHSLAFRNVAAVYGSVPLLPRLDLLVDATEELAAAGARTLGYERWATDWREAIEDPGIGLVDIVTPNDMHVEVALAAIEAGKHVYSEKPLALTAADARRMADAAASAGVTTMVGFTYLSNPAIALARQLIQRGDLGTIWSVRANFSLDAVSDPATPFAWRFERARAGSGALGDLGSHVIALVHALVGPIESVIGQTSTFIAQRKEPGSGALRTVENDDVTHFMARFRNGASGLFEASRVASGHGFDLVVDVVGSLGSVRFDQQAAHQLELSLPGSDGALRGARRVAVGPGHGDFGRFWGQPGLALGLHEVKAIEVHELLQAIAEGRPGVPGFEEGARVSAVQEAVELSAMERRWVDVP